MFDGLQQHVLLQQVLDRIPGQAKLGEYRQRDPIPVAIPRHRQHRIGIPGGVGHGANGNASRDAGEAVPVKRMECHHRLRSLPNLP